MSKSLIRKNQLHPDIADLISGYGSNFFLTAEDLPGGVVTISGNQTIDGYKDFSTRPSFSGIPLATVQEGSIFDGNRIITRTSFPVGLNVSGNDIISFLNNVFFPFSPATISLNAYGLQELGTTFGQVPFNGTIIQNSETQINNLQYMNNNTVLSTVPSPNFGNFSSGFELNLTSNTTLRARVTANNNGSPDTFTSSQNVIFEAPSYAGSGNLNLTNNGLILRNVLSGQSTPSNNGKLLILEPAEITINFTTNEYYYFVYPSNWGLLSQIKDASLGFNFDINGVDFINGTLSIPLANGTDYTYRWYRNTNPITLSNYGVKYIF